MTIREFSAQKQQQMCFTGCIARYARRSAQTTNLRHLRTQSPGKTTHCRAASHLQTNIRLLDHRAAQCYAGKLCLNATGAKLYWEWSGSAGQTEVLESASINVLTSSIEYMAGPGPSVAAHPSSILPLTKAFLDCTASNRTPMQQPPQSTVASEQALNASVTCSIQ